MHTRSSNGLFLRIWRAIMEDVEDVSTFSIFLGKMSPDATLNSWSILCHYCFLRSNLCCVSVMLIAQLELEDPRQPSFCAKEHRDASYEETCVFHQCFSIAVQKCKSKSSIVSPDSELDHHEWEWPYHSHGTADLFAKSIYKSCIIHAKMLMGWSQELAVAFTK